MLKAIAVIMDLSEGSCCCKTAVNDDPSHRANIEQLAMEIASVQI